MSVQFALPDLGENIESGDVIRILVDVGDRLAEDQTVIELETDKAVIEVPSSIDGTVYSNSRPTRRHHRRRAAHTRSRGRRSLGSRGTGPPPELLGSPLPTTTTTSLSTSPSPELLGLPLPTKKPLPRLHPPLQTAPSQPRHRRAA